MTPKEHQADHIRLHKELDILVACYLSENRKEMGRTSIHDEIFALMKWAHEKTLAPSPAPGDNVPHRKKTAKGHGPKS